MLLTALTPPLLPQGARAAAEAQAQPLAPRQTIAASASRTQKTQKPARAPIKVVKEPNWRVILDKAVRDRARTFRRPSAPVRDSARQFAVLTLYSPGAGGWIQARARGGRGRGHVHRGRAGSC